MDSFGEDNGKYKLEDYWDERFKDEKSYEWLVDFKSIEDVICPYLDKEWQILIVGCGNSNFSNSLYDLGYVNITNIDFSNVVIENMKEQNKILRPKMEWIKMDMTNMTFENSTFDVVIDKAAMDAIMVDEGDSWDPEEDVISLADNMCLSIKRVLKKQNSLFLQISFAQPHFRTKYLMGYRAEKTKVGSFEGHKGLSHRYGWNLDYKIIDSKTGALDNFLYIMKI